MIHPNKQRHQALPVKSSVYMVKASSKSDYSKNSFEFKMPPRKRKVVETPIEDEVIDMQHVDTPIQKVGGSEK